MRRLLTLFGLIALLATAPALADVTVRYKVKDQPNKAITLAVADNGNARFDSGDGTVLIVREGVGYFVAADRQGPMVGRVEDGVALVTEFIGGMMQIMEAAVQAQTDQTPAAEGQAAAPPAQGGFAQMRAMAAAPYEVEERGREMVAGRDGVLYVVAPAAGVQGPALEIVLSTDDDLAPIGREMRRLLSLVEAPAAAILGQTPDMLREADDLLARGAPIRIGQHFTLASVSAEPIPTSAFELPSRVMSLEELRARLPFGGTAAGRSGGGPVVIRPAPEDGGDPDPDPDPDDE